MADFTWPEDLVPFAQSFYLRPHVGRSESPFTRQQRIYGLSAPLWVCRMSFRGGYNGTSGIEAFGPRLDALIARLEGGLHRIAIWDFRRENDGASFTNAAITAGDAQVTLNGIASGINPGDYIGGDDRPHIVTHTEVSGSDLIAHVKPHFNESVAGGAAIFERVPGYFRLVSDDAGSNGTEVGGPVQYDLEFIEDPGPPADITYEGECLTYSG